MASPINYEIIDNLIRVISINFLILYIRYYFFIQLARDPDNHPKEDYKYFASSLQKNPNEDNTLRRKKIAENDTYNMAYDIIVFFGAFISNVFAVLNRKGEAEAIILMVLICIYTFFRISFSICYLFGKQPWRSICFLFTKLSTIVASCVMISLSFKIKFIEFAK